MGGVLVRGSSTKAGKPFSGGSMKRLHGDTKCSQANWLLQKSGMPVKCRQCYALHFSATYIASSHQQLKASKAGRHDHDSCQP